jgi:hypothetical protein
MLEKVINIIQLCVMLVVGLAMTLGMMAIPLGLLYMLIAPFFGPDPSDHMDSVLLWLLGFAALLFTLWIAVKVGTWAYEKFVYVRIAFKAIGYTLAALLVVATVSNCMSKGGSGGCTPSRYIDC